MFITKLLVIDAFGHKKYNTNTLYMYDQKLVFFGVFRQ